METIHTETLLRGMIQAMLGGNPHARVGIIGPSTLDRDHSVLYWSDALAGSGAQLIVVERPSGWARYTYSSLKLLQHQMGELHKRHPQLCVPDYVVCDAFHLSEIVGDGTLNLVYDHSSLIHIVGERPKGQSMGEATDHILRQYRHVLTPDGKIVLMMPDKHFSGPEDNPNSRTYWQEYVLPGLERNGLEHQLFLSDKDIDMREKFPELLNIGEWKRPQYPCHTLAVAFKR